MTSYVALLRGINVGGKSLIKMADLKACFESLGLDDVRTYIASGNVLFQSPEKDAAKLSSKIEKALGKTFGYKTWVMVKSHEQLRAIVQEAPKGFGTKPAEYYSDVLFLQHPLTVAEAMKVVELREGVDQVFQGKTVLYFSRLSARRVQSKLSKIISTPAYKNMTIRSWNTTAKLLGLLEEKL